MHHLNIISLEIGKLGKEFKIPFVITGDNDCDHNLKFDEEASKAMSILEVRQAYPRLNGRCSKCGFFGIAYASYKHYVAGDW